MEVAGNIFRRRIWVKVTDYCLDRLFGIWGEGKLVEIMFLQVGFHGYIVHHFFCYDMSSVSCVSELVLSFDMFV
jgi:hypothetical protein